MNNNKKKGTCAYDDLVNNEMYYRDTRQTVAIRKSPYVFEFTRSILMDCISVGYSIKMVENLAERTLLHQGFTQTTLKINLV